MMKYYFDFEPSISLHVSVTCIAYPAYLSASWEAFLLKLGSDFLDKNYYSPWKKCKTIRPFLEQHMVGVATGSE